MNLLLDTNICIYLIKKRPPSVLKRFDALPAGTVAISSITVAELEFGVQKSQYPSQNQHAL
jgi:tRNA(fMet)-specific endonuclease VapC